jgi:streptogramin lyase
VGLYRVASGTSNPQSFVTDPRFASPSRLIRVPEACRDGRDDDGDGLADFPADPGCTSAADDDERIAGVACDNGLDDDGDGVADFPMDFGCLHPGDGSERPDCGDGLDNDGDGPIDFPADPQCSNAEDPSEAPLCSNGVDDDGDGQADFPVDPGCASALDDEETDPLLACDDGVDGDGDGLVDFPADPGCTASNDPDASEQSGSLVCDNGLDDDGDTLADFPADPGCTAATDGDERFGTQCDDGLDNDGDGLADFPTDPGCASSGDSLEFGFAPGDVLVLEPVSGAPRILRLNTQSGAQTTLFQGAPLVSPRDIHLDGQGNAWIPDSTADALFRFDLETGAMETVSSGGFLALPETVVRHPNGKLYVADRVSHTIVAIDPETGAQSLLRPPNSFVGATAMEVEPSGQLLVGTQQSQSAGNIYRVDPNGTSHTLLNTSVFDARHLDIRRSDSFIYVADGNTGDVVAVNPSTGAEVVETLSSTLQLVVGIAEEPAPNSGLGCTPLPCVLITNESGTTRGVYRVNPNLGTTGNVTAVSTAFTALPQALDIVEITRCSDGVDQDGDTLVDLADPDCEDRFDGTEWSLAIGDVVTVTSDGNVVRIDPATGAQTLLADVGAGEFVGLGLESSGDLLVTDMLDAELLRIDASDGRVSLVSSGGTSLWASPQQLAARPTGDAVVCDEVGDAILEIDPGSGAQTILSNGGLLSSCVGVALEANGDALVSDLANGLLRVAAGAGAQTQIPVSPALDDPRGLALEDAGHVVVVDSVLDAVYRVALASGTRTTVSSGQNLVDARGIAVEPNGKLVVTESSPPRVLRVDPLAAAGSNQTVLASGGFLTGAPQQVFVVSGDCADDVDDDGDGLTDFPADPGCASATDPTEKTSAKACDDGFDNDADGEIDFPNDVGCKDVNGIESPQCDDNLDNDNEGRIDWDGGPSGGEPDPNCVDKPWGAREKPKKSCGLGFEIAPLLLAFAIVRRRQRARTKPGDGSVRMRTRPASCRS